jgi:hypothetical protein
MAPNYQQEIYAGLEKVFTLNKSKHYQYPTYRRQATKLRAIYTEPRLYLVYAPVHK